MAKLRIFVSSTYYDLRHIRDRLQSFIEGFGYDAVLFESGDIPFQHDRPLDQSCYAEINQCHILTLIIGGRYGSAASHQDEGTEPIDFANKSDFYNSITAQEYKAARRQGIPIFIFVDKNVLAEYETYKKNRNAKVVYAHVDHPNIFKLLDDILAQANNNFIRGFERFDDISAWLRDQWAGLFADLISKKSSTSELQDLNGKIAELGQVTNALKEYSELMIKKLHVEGSQGIIDAQEKKIESSRVRSLVREELVQYLQRTFLHQLNDDKDYTPEAIYEAFQNSKNLSEFLDNLKLTEDMQKEFMERVSHVALRDYRKIAERYFDRGEEENTPPVPSRSSTKKQKKTS